MTRYVVALILPQIHLCGKKNVRVTLYSVHFILYVFICPQHLGGALNGSSWLDFYSVPMVGGRWGWGGEG